VDFADIPSREHRLSISMRTTGFSGVIAMGRRFLCILLVGLGVVLSGVLNSFPVSKAEPAPQSDTPVQNESETIEQLKEVNAQLKELNAMLRSGKARVTVVINADAEQ
jgi:hypothetical protein